MKIDCAFIHGWAMNSAVWQSCLQQLPDWIEPNCIDLPGYGEHVAVHARTLDDYVEFVAQQLDSPALVVGWSLGGLVSLGLAQRYPDKVAALYQLATNPKFVSESHWPCAIEAGVFEQFAASLEHDVSKTIRRFLALQVRGTDTSMHTVRELQLAIDARGLPAPGVLSASLDILANSDLVAVAESVMCPVTWLLGEKDALVPVELADTLTRMPSRPDVQILQGAGHAPFISHSGVFVDSLLRAATQLKHVEFTTDDQ
ncbi:MAG: pimeloyl-ACP methyl ester esterase BioH [Gammaproteobacteria bacterium]|nr:pimeloyl-ACP methyl ester esterase BioH [Gammaproteobacteria bacterium]